MPMLRLDAQALNNRGAPSTMGAGHRSVVELGTRGEERLLMYVHARVVRLSMVVGLLAGLVAVPATAGLATGSSASLSLNAVPPALTLSDTTTRSGLLKATFTSATNPAKQTKLTITASQPIKPEVLPAGCTAPSPTTTFTCDLGDVAPNTTISRLIEFQSPAACASSACTLTFKAKITFGGQRHGDDDRNDKHGKYEKHDNDDKDRHDNRVTLTDTSTVRLFSSADRVQVAADCVTPPRAGDDENDDKGERDDRAYMADQHSNTRDEEHGDRKGHNDERDGKRPKVTTLGVLASRTAQQATRVSFGPAAAALPCVPAAAGVDPQVAPTPLHTKISFVFLPELQQLATVQVSFFSLPPGVNASNFVLFELVNYEFGSQVSGSTPFFPVPACHNDQIPAGGPSGFTDVTFDSCVSAKASFGNGGVLVTLRLRPSGDPGFSG
jgi:hypothetical protein